MPPNIGVPKELDKRSLQLSQVSEDIQMQFKQKASDIVGSLPQVSGLKIEKFDKFSGNPSVIVSDTVERQKGNYTQRAIDFLQKIHPVLGLAPTQPPEFVVDPLFQKTSSGAIVVHLEQQYKGIPIFQAAATIRFTPDGSLHQFVGQNVTIDNDIKAAPGLSVVDAVLKAVQFVTQPTSEDEGPKDQLGQPIHFTPVEISGFLPKVIATFTEKPDRPTVLEAGPFGDEFKARLLWFPLGTETKLSWEVIVTMPNYEAQYRVLVDSDNGEILYSHQLVESIAALGNVHLVDGGGTRKMRNFPRPVDDYGIPPEYRSGFFPADLVDPWVESDSTEGNCVSARLNTGTAYQGVNTSGVIIFNPPYATGLAQLTLNAFYYSCYMHDFFYLLGFTEENGNFQQDNYMRGLATPGSIGNDRVRVIVYPNEIASLGSFTTGTVDGMGPTMSLGSLASNNRHTALDSTVVFHEYTHGVSSRLVGGPANGSALDALQSRGMGEGWGDYIACTINNTDGMGAWLMNDVNKPWGLRIAPYDTNFPRNFGFLTSLNITNNPIYEIGEIWCAALLEMNRRIGKYLALTLVIDAMMLSPANPRLLDMRDSILLALYYKQRDLFFGGGDLDKYAFRAASRGIWGAFSKFGMGPLAKSDGAAFLSGIVTDFTPKADSLNEILRANDIIRPVSIRLLAQRLGFEPPISVSLLRDYLT